MKLGKKEKSTVLKAIEILESHNVKGLESLKTNIMGHLTEGMSKLFIMTVSYVNEELNYCSQRSLINSENMQKFHTFLKETFPSNKVVWDTQPANTNKVDIGFYDEEDLLTARLFLDEKKFKVNSRKDYVSNKIIKSKTV